MALLDAIRPQPDPWECQYRHKLCELHGDGPRDEPGSMDAAPAAGVCYFGCIAPRLWRTPKDNRYLCRRHLRHALKVGGYPLPLDE